MNFIIEIFYFCFLIKEMAYNFDKQEGRLYGTFDYDSIMIYGSYAFSTNGRQTMEVLQKGKKLLEAYQKLTPAAVMTPSDVKGVMTLYKCRA